MTSPSPDGARRNAAIAKMRGFEALTQQTLSTGQVPADQEIAHRLLLAELYVQSFQELQSEALLHYAAQHLEVILSKAPRSSPDYPKYLDLLCQARTSQHLVSSSSHALDMAVDAGREALSLADAGDLVSRDLELHLSLINNLAFALSRRHTKSNKLEDLDEAIMYSRMVYNSTEGGSRANFVSLNNLISQIRRRIEQAHDSELESEAEALLGLLMASTTPGTPEHAMAVGQLGFITAKKATLTGSRADLDEAFRLCKTAFETLPPSHEGGCDILTVIVDTLRQRRAIDQDDAHPHRGDDDLKHLIHYSALLLEALSESSPERCTRVLEYAGWWRQYVMPRPSLEDTDKAISSLWRHLSTMPLTSWEREDCQVTMCDLLAKRYKMTENLHDLLMLIKTYEAILSERDATPARVGPSKLPASPERTWRLKVRLAAVTKSPADNAMSQLASRELASIFASAWNLERPAVLVLEDVAKNCSPRLQVIADAIKESETLSEPEISRRVEALLLLDEKDKATKTSCLDKQAIRKAGSSKHTAFGNRTLAPDEETGSIVWEFSGQAITAMLGYGPDEPKSLPMEQFIIREKRLERHAVEEARSAGRRPNLALCRMCRDIARPLRLNSSNGKCTLTDENIWLPFGNFFQLSCRTHCVFCRLVLSAITTEAGELHPSLAAIDKEVQGTKFDVAISPSGDAMLEIKYGLKHVGTVRLAAPDNYESTIRQWWECTTGDSLQADVALSFEHIVARKSQQASPSLLKSWLEDCSTNHSSPCQDNKSVVSSNDEMPMVFIDVTDDCLVASTSRQRYFALSYVWGSVDMCNTVKDNFELRQSYKSLSDVPFPKTIKDAISFVKSLGERYLWVDAICMVQDDKEWMDRNIPKMNIVYGQAFATIVALHGDNANAGLPGVSPGTRRPQRIERLHVSKGSPELDYDPDKDNGKSDTLCLTVTPRPLDLQLDLTRWKTRGWIFQEHLLSRRCLFFARDAVYFQCARHTLCEFGNDAHTGPIAPKSSSKGKEKHLTAAGRENALDLLPSLQDTPSEEQLDKMFRVYMSLVQTYTRREFSFKSDIINGFAGVFSVLERHFASESHSGLPAAVLAHALLWTPAGRIPRRGMRLPTIDNLNMGAPLAQFPSWSWAGWDGPVEYRLFVEKSRDLPLPTPLWSDYGVGVDSRHVDEDAPKEEPAARATEEDHPSPKAQLGFGEPSSGGSVSKHSPVACSRAPPAAEEPEDPSTRLQDSKIVGDPSRGSSWVVGLPGSGLSGTWDKPPDVNMLRFAAPVTTLSSFSVSPEKEYLVRSRQTHVQGSQAVRRIHDRRGHQCGLWWEQAGYGWVGLSMDGEAEGRLYMAGISAHPNAQRRRCGPSRVEGDIHLFDGDAFPSVGPGSGVVNILVVDGADEDGTIAGYRVTVAVMHQKAWEQANPTEMRLCLA